jgi:hypothetical protein
VRNGVAILSGKKGFGRNRVANILRNRGVISRVEKGKIAQSCCSPWRDTGTISDGPLQ